MITPGWLPVHRNFGAGGIEVHVHHLVKGLVKRGHKITIITTMHPEKLKKEKIDNLNIFFVGDSPLRCTEKFYQESVVLFNQLNQKENFEIVHTQDYAGYGYAKYDNEVPLVITSHGTPINMLKSIIRVGYFRSFIRVPFWIKCHFFMEPLLLKNSSRIIAVANELAKDIEEQYKIPEEKIIVISNGIDVEQFKPKNLSTLKQDLGIKEEKIVLFVGVISKQKGLHILLKALKHVLEYRDDVRLIIVGQGHHLKKIKCLTEDLKIKQNVIFTGRISNEDLPEYYNIADIIVVPSTGAEGLPVVIVESMATGKPVIASKIGGIPTAIEHFKEGILVEPRNSNELSEKILELLNNREMAENLGKAGRKKALEQFSLDRMIEQTIKVYEECRN